MRKIEKQFLILFFLAPEPLYEDCFPHDEIFKLLDRDARGTFFLAMWTIHLPQKNYVILTGYQIWTLTTRTLRINLLKEEMIKSFCPNQNSLGLLFTASALYKNQDTSSNISK
jgi:hypothetical protein